MRFPEYDGLDATAVGEWIASRRVSAAEVVEAALERIEARNPALNAVVERWPEDARRVAALPLPAGPLSGVPILVKDLRAGIAGHPLFDGSRLQIGWRPEEDAEIVRRMRAAGLVLLGRTNTPEFGLLPTTEPVLRGPTKNPWSAAHSPGGSSGGSAAAVAARIVPIAHGGDGGGSIRIPSSACGLFGLKPSRGRVSLAPDGEVWSGLGVEHVLTRSVRDSALLLDLLAGPAPGDPYSAPPAGPWREEAGARPGRLRIAFTTTPLLGGATDPECRTAVVGAAKLLADLGHEVEEAAPVLEGQALAHAMVTIVGVAMAHDVEVASRRTGRRASTGTVEIVTLASAAVGRALSAVDLDQALSAGKRARLAMAAFHEKFDLLLTPTIPRPPPRLGEILPGAGERLAARLVANLPLRAIVDSAVPKLAAAPLAMIGNTAVFNFTGAPAASVPFHWTADGLPVGVQLAAPYGDEATIFRVAAQIEGARPWAGLLPPGISR